MKPEDELVLSFYKDISPVDSREDLTLVQHIETKALFVRKRLKTYDREVYEALKNERFHHVPQIAEAIEDGGELIVIEEYIQGQTLEKILEERRFSEEETRDITIKICDILAPIHGHLPPIVHRDIKPGNIVIRDDQPYIIDFDISRDYDPEESRDTVLMGTRMYAAPEQFGFHQSTPRTDIYAIGVTMNVMLTGKSPGEGIAGGSIGDIIKKCTAIDPEDRYADVSLLREALEGKNKRFAPPGFRDRKPLFMVLMSLWYLMIPALSLTMNVMNIEGGPAGTFETIATRTATFVILLGMTLYLGNYLSFLTVFPFRKTSNMLIEVVRILIGCALIFFVPLVVVAIIIP